MKHNCISTRCDGITRRDLIRIGGLSALGLGFSHWPGRMLRADNTRQKAGIAKNCILIWLDGGPSHLETFDPKPEAPREIRGPLGTVGTSLAGIRLSECLAETAKRMDRIAIVRSMTSPLGEHNFGTHYLMTGYQPTPVLDYPAFTSVAALTKAPASVLPSNIAVPNFRVGGSGFNGGGFLDHRVRPFSLNADPAKPNFRIPGLDFYPGLNARRIDRRREFVKQLEQLDSRLQSGPSPSGAALEQAFDMVTSQRAREAFDLSQESQATRRRYGGKTIGQSCLLARRLIESGVPFVTVNNPGWDTHESLTTRLKDGYVNAQVPVGLAPSLDLALTALLDDLSDRRMLDETLVVVMGEFGRTPKLNVAGGRDHWPRVFSVLLAGGGIKSGQIVGSSDKVGEQPQSRPVTPAELVATIYQLLGIDPKLTLKTPDARPIRIVPDGTNPIRELLG